MNRYFLISILRRHGTPKSSANIPVMYSSRYHSQTPHNSTGNVVQAKTPPRGITTQFTFQSFRAPLFFHFTYKATWNRKNQSANIRSLHFPKRPIIPPEMLCRQKPPARGFLTQFTFQSYHEPLFFNFNFKTTWNPKIGRRISRWCIQVAIIPKHLTIPPEMSCKQKPPPRGITTQFTFQSYRAPLFFHFTYKATWNRKNQSENSLHFSQTPHNSTGNVVQTKNPGQRLLNAIYISVLSWTVIF